MRRLGRERSDDNELDIEANKLLWGIYQFTITLIIIALIAWPISKVWSAIGSSEEVWTDFSPETPTEMAEYIERNDEEEKLDKDKYRVYFEDKELVIMVLGGLEWWKKKCGTLSGTGEYFMNLAIEKHGINTDELIDNMTFQTGHFAAALYNDCDIFLEQTKSIGLDMMLMKTPQEIQLDTIPEVSI